MATALQAALLPSGALQEAPELLLNGELARARAVLEPLAYGGSDDATVQHLLGLLELRENRLDEAIRHLERAVELSPVRPAWWRDLGLVLLVHTKGDRALCVLSRAVQLHPADGALHKALGRSLLACGSYEQSLASFRRAYELDSSDKEAPVYMAQALMGLQRYAAAAGILEAALEEVADSADAHVLLAEAYERAGQTHRALGHHEQAYRLRPDAVDARVKLASAYWDTGDLRRSLELIRPLVEAGQASPKLHSFYLSCLLHSPEQTANNIREAHERWAAVHAGHIRGQRDWPNDRDPDRRIRVGYVGGDFYENPSYYFLISFFRNHDHDQVEVFGYDLRCRDDLRTAQFRKYSDGWRRGQGRTDEQTLDQIRADRIDILVDTTGHYAGNGLALFASRPAPVQVALLNYPGTTGLGCFDGIVADPWVCPEGAEDQFTEPVLRLASGYLPYAPPEGAPAVPPLPFLRNGFLTFALLQRPVKIAPQAWDAIAAVLRANPGSRLLIHNVFEHLAYPDSPMQRFYAEALATRGVSRSRLDFAAPCRLEQHLRLVAEADIALDTFPYNGQTTTCECLWMGVPVVTLSGAYHVARVGRSILQRAGFPEWETRSSEEYIATACKLVSDPESLAATRASMRARLSSSLLLSGDKVTRELEGAYRALWRRYCQKENAVHVN